MKRIESSSTAAQTTARETQAKNTSLYNSTLIKHTAKRMQRQLLEIKQLLSVQSTLTLSYHLTADHYPSPMKFLFDLFPILLFFIAFKIWGIFVATAVAIGTAVLQIIWVFARHRRVDTMLWVNLGIISVFGGATLFFHNELFIKWKPTVLYTILAGALLASKWFWNKNLLQMMMGNKLLLPRKAWAQLNVAWASFFLILAIFNIVIAYTCSTQTWVTFKLLGSTIGMVIFVIAQSIWLTKYLRHTTDALPQKKL